jgi:hypothetical protein
MILVACGNGASHEAPDASTDSGADAANADGRSTCDAGGAARAVLVAISASDEVDLYTLQGGHLIAAGSKVTGIDRPDQIVMRDDGAEAITIYGGYGSPFGVAVIAIDGTTVRLAQTLQIGTDSTAISIAYADHDHAVIALEAQNDEVVGIARGASGFVAGARVPAPASYPLAVRARPGSSDVLLARSQVGVDPNMDIYRLDAGASGTWTSVGPHTSVGPNPITMALHSSGNALYVPTGDPSNPVTSKNLDAPSLLHAVTIGSNSFTAAGTATLPRIASMVTADPLGRFVVTEGNHYVLDGNGNPNVIGYNFQTVLVGSDGALGDVHATMDPTAGLLFDDLEVAPSGHLIAAREMYEGSVPVAMQYPLELWAQPEWGAWTLCDTAYLSGGAHVAIAR